jgi:hypothetical protein
VTDYGIEVASKDLTIAVDGVVKAIYVITRIVCSNGKDLFVLLSHN